MFMDEGKVVLLEFEKKVEVVEEIVEVNRE